MKITKILFIALIPFLSNAQSVITSVGSTKDIVAEIPAIAQFKKTIGADTVDLDALGSYKYNRDHVAKANTDFSEEVVIVPSKNQLSRKKTLLKRDFYYILNNNEGWIKIPMGSLDKKPTYNTKNFSKTELEEHTSEVKDGIFPFINFAEKGYKLTTPATTVSLEGKSVTKIAIEKGDIKREYYFDATTGVLVKEVFIQGGITHTYDGFKFASTNAGVQLPVEANYINSRDKRKTTITTKWNFKNPIEGVSFAK